MYLGVWNSNGNDFPSIHLDFFKHDLETKFSARWRVLKKWFINVALDPACKIKHSLKIVWEYFARFQRVSKFLAPKQLAVPPESKRSQIF